MCYPLTIQDDATRFVLCVDGYDSISTNGVIASFRRVFREHGIPDRIHSDNGSPFTSTGIGRLSRVSVQWMRQGIEVCRSRVGHPQDNPHHERMYQTLKNQTARTPSATACAFLSTALAGEAVGLNEIDEGIWRVCFRSSVLCFVNAGLDTPTVITEPPEEVVAEYNQRPILPPQGVDCALRHGDICHACTLYGMLPRWSGDHSRAPLAR